MANKPIHILRYGTVAEKVHLEKAISAYDYLSINGNIYYRRKSWTL